MIRILNLKERQNHKVKKFVIRDQVGAKPLRNMRYFLFSTISARSKKVAEKESKRTTKEEESRRREIGFSSNAGGSERGGYAFASDCGPKREREKRDRERRSTSSV